MTSTSGPPATRDAARPRLVRAIGRWDYTAAVINAVIGSSIFGMPATITAMTGAWSPLAFALAGAGVLAIVLCFAEVASRFDQPGGPYLYGREAFGTAVGFQAGWLTFWIRVTAVAANLNVFTSYLGQLAPVAGHGAGRVAVMAVVMAVITAINIRGVRQATWTVDAFTIAKLAPLALLIVLGLPRVSGETLATQQVASADWTGAVLLLVYAYGGFEAPLITAGEVKDPRRDTAFALLVALAVIAAVYMLVQLVVVGILPDAARAEAPLAAAFAVLIGPAGVVLASAAAMISIWGWATGTVLQSPRVLYAMADRGELPAVLGRVHRGFRTPWVSILAFAALALAMALYGSFQWNATLSAIVRLVTYGMTCAALVRFRRTRADAPAFRAPWAGLVVPVALAFCVWLLSTRTFTQAWILVAIMAAGWALSRVARSADRGPEEGYTPAAPMKRELLILRPAPPGADPVSAPLGSHDEVRAALRAALGDVVFHDPGQGVFQRSGISLVAKLGVLPVVESMTLQIWGDADPAELVRELCVPRGWQAIDLETGDALDLGST